jgi:hypothetical protein
MSLLVAWALYPLALAALALGLGLGLERLAAWRLPGGLVLCTGLAAAIALSRLVTESSALAPLALPLLLVLAVAGLVAGRARLRAVPASQDRPFALASLGVFAVFAAPVVLSGAPTFAGYLALPDTSHQLTLAWLYAEQGPDWQSLPFGMTSVSARGLIETAYPVAGQATLGVTAPLGVVDLAWLYQPFLTVMAVASALAIGALVAPWVRGRWAPALMAFLAVQASLVLGFALQGSIKEMTALAMLLTTAALLARLLLERRPPRALLVPAVSAVAMVGALGPAAALYLALPTLVGVGAAGWRARQRGRRARDAGWLAVTVLAAAILALPILTSLGTALSVQATVLEASSAGQLTGDRRAAGTAEDGVVLGNLARPLDEAQALGVWLNGDFRLLPQQRTLQRLVSALVALAVVVGGVWALRRRAWGPLLLAVPVGLVSLYLLSRGSPYADAKVLMLVSPVAVLLALLGANALREGGGRLRPLGVAALGALAAGLLVSSALAYHDVSLAPYDRYSELLDIRERLAGEGPVIFLENDEFAEYFLRGGPVYGEPELGHDYREKPYEGSAATDPDRRPSLKSPVDADDLTLEYLLEHPYVVTRRSPLASRPPSAFRQAWEGEHYVVWENTGRRVSGHMVLGRNVLDPAGRASCEGIEELIAQTDVQDGRLAFVERPLGPVLKLTEMRYSSTWGPYENYPGALTFQGPGVVQGTFEIDEAQRFRVWLEGSVSRAITVEVDGRRVGQIEDHLNNPGAFLPVGEVVLQPGEHEVRISMGGGTLAPGDAGYSLGLRHIGPLVFSPPGNAVWEVETVPVNQWRSLCGRRLDWVEVVPALGGSTRPPTSQGPTEL